MEKYVDRIVEFIRNEEDFKYSKMESDYDRKVGDTLSLSVDGSRNLSHNHMGATIIEGILQAGLKFDTVVKPRVDKFKDEFRTLKTTTEFYNIIHKQNLSELLNFKGPKIDRILAVTQFLKDEHVETENDFYRWFSKKENEFRLLNIKGVKDKTVNYFKLLCGYKDVVAVDVRLKSFIAMCCSGMDEVKNNELAAEILMRVAEKLKIEPATLDFSIWSYMARGQDTND
jgi:thermostable 8-oxoguanine DNA glycosylase